MPPKSARSWRRRPTRGGHTRSCALCTGRTKRPPSCVFRAEPTAVCACGAQGFLCPWNGGRARQKKGRGGNKQQQGRGGNNQQTEQGRTGKTGRPGNAASEWKWVLRRPGWCKDTRCKDDFGRAHYLPAKTETGTRKKTRKGQESQALENPHMSKFKSRKTGTWSRVALHLVAAFACSA